MMHEQGRARLGASALGLFLLVCSSTGCSSSGTTSGYSAQNTYKGGEDAPLEELRGDRSLAGKLEMEQVRSERRDGRLHVQFELRNKSTSNLAFGWMVEWFDDSGFLIDYPSHWTPVSMGGQAYKTISVTAPVPAASQWRLAVEPLSNVR